MLILFYPIKKKFKKEMCDFYNDKAILHYLTGSERVKPYSDLGKKMNPIYSTNGFKKMQYQEPSCDLRTDSIDEATFFTYGSGTLTRNELIGGKYMQFIKDGEDF